MSENKKIRSMTAEELSTFVKDYCDGHILTDRNVPAGTRELIFMPVFLGAFSEWTEEELAEVGLIWQHQSKHTSARCINSYPIFLKVEVMSCADLEKVGPVIVAELARRKEEESKRLASFAEAGS